MSQHDLTGDRLWSRALIGGSGGETPRPLVKLQTHRRLRKSESGLLG